MNPLKRFSKKDKYGIVRGCITLCALFVLSAVFFLLAQQSRVLLSRAQDVASVTSRVAAQFDQYIDDADALLDGFAADFDKGLYSEAEALNVLSVCTQFEDVAIEAADGLLTELIGIENAAGIQLRKPLQGGREIVVTLSTDAMHAIFSGAFSGDYSYSLYNTNTGVYLFGSDEFDSASYYDVLLNMVQDGKVENMPDASDEYVNTFYAKLPGGKYYITQSEDESYAYGVSFIVPAATAVVKSYPVLPMLATAILPLVFLILIVVIFTRSTLRRIRNSNRNIARALDIGEQMVNIAARDSRITILVIGYGHEGVLSCHDGLGLTNSTTFIRSISDIESACGMAEGEMDRVYECMNKLTTSRSAALTVHCHTANHEDRSLRISFHAAEDGGRNILCSISDCTRELASQYIAEQERSYMSSAKRRASSVWKVNVSRNRWRAVHIGANDPLYKLSQASNVWRDYNADLSGALSDHIHPADYHDFAERAGIPGIAAAFRSGTTEFTLEYRVSTNQANVYEWHRLYAHLLTDPKTDDIIANFYLYNVDAKKNAELERGERKRVLQQTLTALSGIYSGLYYVDLDNDLCYTARSRDGDLSDQLCMPYQATFDHYIDAHVHEDDREALRKVLSSYQLKRTMAEGSHFRSCIYRRSLGDGSYAKTSIVVQPARFENGAIKEIALAIREIEREIETE